MPMPKKETKALTVSVSLPLDLMARLDKNRNQDESRSAQFARLLETALTIKEDTMAKPDYTLEKDCKVGIYNAEYIARVYSDKIIVTTPYVKWVDNSGSYAEKKESIRDQSLIDEVRREIEDDAETTAWQIIGRHLGDEYLMF